MGIKAMHHNDVVHDEGWVIVRKTYGDMVYYSVYHDHDPGPQQALYSTWTAQEDTPCGDIYFHCNSCPEVAPGRISGFWKLLEWGEGRE